jgi:undecaprenyl-diphosphatase
LDISIFHWINDWPSGFAPFFIFLSEATKELWVKLALALLFLGLVANRGTRVPAITAILAFPLANGITDVLKHSFHVLRPCVELWPNLNLRVGLLDSFGTASAHSANTMAVAAVFLYYKRQWGLIPLAIAILTGFSRIYVGVHYPSQVLLGWLCGLVAAAVIIAAWGLILKKGKATDEPS